MEVLDISVTSKYRQYPLRERIWKQWGVEVTDTLEIFRRSDPLYGVRYVNYLGVGDSKSFLLIKEAKSYGDNVEIHKLEFICHIKRMGSRLLKLKS